MKTFVRKIQVCNLLNVGAKQHFLCVVLQPNKKKIPVHPKVLDRMFRGSLINLTEVQSKDAVCKNCHAVLAHSGKYHNIS